MQEFSYLNVQLLDLPEADVRAHFPATRAFIREHIQGQGAVLVHCNAGVSRSVRFQFLRFPFVLLPGIASPDVVLSAGDGGAGLLDGAGAEAAGPGVRAAQGGQASRAAKRRVRFALRCQLILMRPDTNSAAGSGGSWRRLRRSSTRRDTLPRRHPLARPLPTLPLQLANWLRTVPFGRHVHG